MKKSLNITNLVFAVTCLILIITYIYQLTAYNNMNKKYKATMDDGKDYTISDSKYMVEGNASVYPRKLNEFMEKYDGEFESIDIGRRLFKFINSDLNVLYNEYKDKDDDAIKVAYGQNENDINSIKVVDQENALALFKQVKRIKDVKNDIKFKQSGFDIETMETNNLYAKCVLNIDYESNSRVSVVLRVPYNKNEEIEFENYSELEKIYKTYSGPITKDELEKVVDLYRDQAIKQFCEKFKRKSVNDVKSFYRNNTEFMNTFQVYSADDLFYISDQCLNYKFESSTKITYYTVEQAEGKNDLYSVYDIKYRNTDSDVTGTFKLYLAKKSNIDPVFKVSAETIELNTSEKGE